MLHLTRSQEAGLAQALGKLESQMREDLRTALLNSGDSQYVELAGRVHDRGDESVADMLSELSGTMVDRHLQELREIEAARRRLADASINRCDECGGDIGYQRLLAYPVAVRCIACQQQFEKTHHHESAPRL